MICNACGQNEATIHLTEIMNNQMVEVHLCESCAEQKGSDFKTHFDFNKLLASLSDIGVTGRDEAGEKLTCKTCSMSYEDFGRTGRLGCADCYRFFERVLTPLLKRVQRELRHVGKVPAKATGEMKWSVELRDLHERLKKCIAAETFEEAAQIRDRIHQLEERVKKSDKKQK
ncbi:MAG: hypothetical protein A3G87_07590 [Omnitrophica bacterium RIFCSPLOWO2_12_FULL_50_11]|nr:MAG: hypothetical protein A3G87_07590 [Omnitrophica bacterium RIFCSPLOWO2_12_FULL_50_11]